MTFDEFAHQWALDGKPAATQRIVRAAWDEAGKQQAGQIKMLMEALSALLPDAEQNHVGGPDTAERLEAARAAIAKLSDATENTNDN